MNFFLRPFVAEERGAMGDFFEIDFLDVETDKSGDAITVHYELNGHEFIHVVDAGFQASGAGVVRHIRAHYGALKPVNHVVVTHSDGDHTGGVRTILEEMVVGELWMLRPWRYASEIIHRFENYTSVDRLSSRLKSIYSNLAALEEIAEKKGIPIREPFQGAAIGAFTVLAPTKPRYLDLIVQSEKTPEASEMLAAEAANIFELAKAHIVNLVKRVWGAETFPADGTSAENEMSVVQYANLCGERILLTGDAGRDAMSEAADYAPFVGLALPGIDRIQVPHHGSRHNVSSEILDRWLGPKLSAMPKKGEESFTAICSSAKADRDHPRKSVHRAFVHRGAKFLATESQSIRTQQNAPKRDGWTAIEARPYPEDEEED